MALFFQLDIRAEFGLPFKQGSHLLVFMCPTHNEPPGLPSIYDKSPLPQSYWDADNGHFSLLLFPPGAIESNRRLDEYIAPYSLAFEPAEEEIQDFGDFDVGSYNFKVGGVPGWMNYQIDKRCTCGGEMSFICQTPDGFGFKVYILGCNRQCDPRAVIAACDNL